MARSAAEGLGGRGVAASNYSDPPTYFLMGIPGVLSVRNCQ